MPTHTPEVLVGISGWRYAPWRGVFYPRGLAQRRELEFAARQFGSIELNGSFYSLQRPESYQRWRADTPAGFVFAVKGPRYVTHMLRLRNARTAMANFFASGVLALGDRLGPLLWQLPERQAFDEGQLADFFELLPRSTSQAAALGREHNEKVEGREYLEPGEDRALRHALEVRSPTFVDERLYELLRRADVGLVVADTAGRWPLLTETTSDFVYVRLHGSEELYVSGYSDAELEAWADRIRAWKSDGRDVYVYFDNDAKVHAPFDALALQEKLGEATG